MQCSMVAAVNCTGQVFWSFFSFDQAFRLPCKALIDVCRAEVVAVITCDDGIVQSFSFNLATN